jgi:putative ABC transport system permease protein
MLKQLWNERKTNAWLWAELLVVLIALWIVTDWSYTNIYIYLQPKGFNSEHTYRLTFNKLPPKSTNYVPAGGETGSSDSDDFLAIVERLRHHPDIEYISCSVNASPYNDSNNHETFGQDSVSVKRLVRVCTPDFFNVFQYANADGTGSASLAEAFTENTIIVPVNFWEERYPAGKNLSGQSFYQNNDTTHALRVAALTQPVRYNDFMPDWKHIYSAVYMGEDYISHMISNYGMYPEVCIRTRPGMPAGFTERLMNDSPRNYNVGNCYIQSILSFDKIRHKTQLDRVNALKKRSFIMLFLLVNIFLGITGTFWYRTQQRRSELALRIALGSSPSSLSLLLIGEGLLLLALAAIPALPVCYAIGNADLTDVAEQVKWGMARFIPGAAITLALMVLMIVAGIWYPACQATKIQPAEALHEE